MTWAALGVRRSLLLVMAVLFLDLTTGYDSIPWQWPVVTWQMYRNKTRLEPLVKYRRLVAHGNDGSYTPTSDCGTLPVLESPYRMDSMLRQDLVGLLSVCLRELASLDPSVVAVSLESREWRYQQQPLEEHLQRSAQHAFRVAAAPAPIPPELGDAGSAGNLVKNGDFEAIDPESGLTPHWTNPSARQGIAVDLATGSHLGLVPALRVQRVQSLRQEFALPAAPGPARLQVSALAFATQDGASVELSIPCAGRATAPIDADGAWHRVELSLDCDARPEPGVASLQFSNAGGADAFVNRVSARELPLPATR